eukprot:gene3965-4218_t
MLHRSSSSKKNAHVVWDEDNLKENAEVQKEYSHCKIQEPKTPYHAPLPDGDLDDDMKPLDLDEEGKQQLLHGASSKANAAVMTAFDFVMGNGGADYEPPLPTRSQMAPSSSNASADDERVQSAVGDKRTEPSYSCTSSGSEGAGSMEKKRRFQQMRRQHYNMKAALQKAKQLLASEDEEDFDDVEDEEADTAGWHRSQETYQELDHLGHAAEALAGEAAPAGPADAAAGAGASNGDMDGGEYEEGASKKHPEQHPPPG